MYKNKNLFLGLLAAGGCLIANAASASMVFTFEAPGVQQTTVSGAVTETFDALNGYYATYTSAAIGGTYTSLNVAQANVYGGANGSMFANLNGSPLVTTLTFNNAKTYFGMWWSAGDITDKLEFFSGGGLVGTFQVGDLIPYLSAGYYGNPNGGGNNGEPYAYVNFTGINGTTFDKVVLTETDGGGFESDNHSVYDQPIVPPGNPVVPEPSTIIAGMLLMAPFGLSAARRYLK